MLASTGNMLATLLWSIPQMSQAGPQGKPLDPLFQSLSFLCHTFLLF